MDWLLTKSIAIEKIKRLFRLAASNKQLEAMRLLLVKTEVEINSQDIAKALQISAEIGHLDGVKLLLESKPISKVKGEALISAAKHNQTEVIELLLKNGFIANEYLREAFIAAAAAGHDAVVNLWLVNKDSRIITNEVKDKAFVQAAQNNQSKMMKSLSLSKKISANAIDAALIEASKFGCRDAVKMLFAQTDYEITLNDRKKILFHAALNWRFNIVMILLGNSLQKLCQPLLNTALKHSIITGMLIWFASAVSASLMGIGAVGMFYSLIPAIMVTGLIENRNFLRLKAENAVSRVSGMFCAPVSSEPLFTAFKIAPSWTSTFNYFCSKSTPATAVHSNEIEEGIKLSP